MNTPTDILANAGFPAKKVATATVMLDYLMVEAFHRYEQNGGKEACRRLCLKMGTGQCAALCREQLSWPEPLEPCRHVVRIWGRHVCQFEAGSVDSSGNIRVDPTHSAVAGTVLIAHKYLPEAMKFGWKKVGERDGLAEVART